MLDSWARCSRRKQPVVAPTFGRLGLAHGLVKRWAITARCAPDKRELHSTVERKSPGDHDESLGSGPRRDYCSNRSHLVVRRFVGVECLMTAVDGGYFCGETVTDTAIDSSCTIGVTRHSPVGPWRVAGSVLFFAVCAISQWSVVGVPWTGEWPSITRQDKTPEGLAHGACSWDVGARALCMVVLFALLIAGTGELGVCLRGETGHPRSQALRRASR